MSTWFLTWEQVFNQVQPDTTISEINIYRVVFGDLVLDAL